MNQVTRENYYNEADRILREAELEWDDVVHRIEVELRDPDAANPIIAAVVDLREISPQDALHEMKRTNPFQVWRKEMWSEYEQGNWAGAFVNSFQGFTQMSNAEKTGLYVDAASPKLKVLRSELGSRLDELAVAGLHK